MMSLPIPASVIPVGGPWGSAAPVTIDGTPFAIVLAVFAVTAILLASASIAARWADHHVPRVRARRLRTHSA